MATSTRSPDGGHNGGGGGPRGRGSRCGGWAADGDGRSGCDLGRRGGGGRLLRFAGELCERDRGGDAGEAVRPGNDRGGGLAQAQLRHELGEGIELDDGSVYLRREEREMIGGRGCLRRRRMPHRPHDGKGEGRGQAVEDGGKRRRRGRHRTRNSRDCFDQHLEEVAARQSVEAEGRGAAPTPQDDGGDAIDSPALDELWLGVELVEREPELCGDAREVFEGFLRRGAGGAGVAASATGHDEPALALVEVVDGDRRDERIEALAEGSEDVRGDHPDLAGAGVAGA